MDKLEQDGLIELRKRSVIGLIIFIIYLIIIIFSFLEIAKVKAGTGGASGFDVIPMAFFFFSLCCSFQIMVQLFPCSKTVLRGYRFLEIGFGIISLTILSFAGMCDTCFFVLLPFLPAIVVVVTGIIYLAVGFYRKFEISLDRPKAYILYALIPVFMSVLVFLSWGTFQNFMNLREYNNSLKQINDRTVAYNDLTRFDNGQVKFNLPFEYKLVAVEDYNLNPQYVFRDENIEVMVRVYKTGFRDTLLRNDDLGISVNGYANIIYTTGDSISISIQSGINKTNDGYLQFYLNKLSPKVKIDQYKQLNFKEESQRISASIFSSFNGGKIKAADLIIPTKAEKFEVRGYYYESNPTEYEKRTGKQPIAVFGVIENFDSSSITVKLRENKWMRFRLTDNTVVTNGYEKSSLAIGRQVRVEYPSLSDEALRIYVVK